MGNPTFVQAHATAGGVTGSYTVELPPGIVIGNLLLMAVDTWDGSISASAGWTLAEYPATWGPANGVNTAFFWREVDGTETEPVINGGGSGVDAVIYEYTDVDFTLGPFDATGWESSKAGDATSFAAPSYDVSQDGSALLDIFVASKNPTVVTAPPTGATIKSNTVGNTIPVNVVLADQAVDTGTVASSDWTQSGSMGFTSTALRIALIGTPGGGGGGSSTPSYWTRRNNGRGHSIWKRGGF